MRVQNTYSVRRDNKGGIPDPTTQIVQSLYDISLQSYMPTFINNKFSQEGIPKSIYEDLIKALPLDLPLEQVIKIKSNDYWRRKLLCDYKVNYELLQARGNTNSPLSEYFRLFLQGLLEDRQLPQYFGNVPTAADGQLEQVLGIPEIKIPELCLAVENGFPYLNLVKKLKLQSLQLKFVESSKFQKPNQESHENAELNQTEMPNETQADPYDDDEGKPKKRVATLPVNAFLQRSPEQGQNNTIRGRTLIELAQLTDGDTYNSVFPFHQLYDQKKMQTGMKLAQQETYELLRMSRRAKICDADISNLRILFPETQTQPGGTYEDKGNQIILEKFGIICSGLNNNQIGPLTVILSQSNIKQINLSGNEIDELSELLKLFASIEGRCCLQGVDLSRNFIRENGAAQLMKALQFEHCGVQWLNLQGNHIQNGFLLIFNGILGSAIKFNNKTLQWLDISDCGIEFKEEHSQVIEKLFKETGIQYLNISGNKLDDLDIESLQITINGVGGRLIAWGAGRDANTNQSTHQDLQSASATAEHSRVQTAGPTGQEAVAAGPVGPNTDGSQAAPEGPNTTEKAKEEQK